MERQRPKLWQRFQVKVLMPVIAVMAALVIVTMFVVNRRITRQLETQAAQSLLNSDAVFQNSQRIRAKNLLLRYGGVPNESRVKAVAQKGDPKTMRHLLDELVSELGCDFALFNADKSRWLASASRDPLVDVAPFVTATVTSVRRALGDRPNVDTVVVGGKLFDVISVPIDLDRNVVGAMTFGIEIGESVVTEFEQLTRREIVLLAHDQVAVATIQKPELYPQFVAMFEKRANGATQPVTPTLDSVRRLELDGEHYLVLPGRFASLSGDQNVGYLLLSSLEGSLAALRDTQRTLLLVGLLGVVVSTATVWMLVRTVSRPLRLLRDGAEAVGRGDFSYRVPVRTRDEFGALAETFNQMTENVKASREQLEKTVETLSATKAQLTQSEKLSAVGEFVAGVTHELNNPLSSVIGFAELLERTNVDQRQRQYVERIVSESGRCHKIVQSLLSFARQHAPERKVVNLNQVVEATLDILSYQLRTSNIEVIRLFQPDLPNVIADAHQMQQVFVNIINNARQAIESHRNRGSLRIATQRIGEHVKISFQDSGPGISKEHLGKIFSPFFTTKEVGKGTGLGLSLCYGIVQEHGGTIKVRSRHGEGATFIIELPAVSKEVEASNAANENPGANPAHCGAGKRALVVDDEHCMTELLGEVLAADDFQVDTAGDGKTALVKLERGGYDLVVCDMKMPGMTGRELFERLRVSHPALSRRFVFITGDVVSGKTREFFEQAGTPYLAKPFSIEQFRATISGVGAVNGLS